MNKTGTITTARPTPQSINQFTNDSIKCSNILNTKLGQLILREIIKIDATRCQILRLKCTKFDFGWGSAPDPARGAHSAPPDPLVRFNGPTSKGRGWVGKEGAGEGGEGRERGECGHGKGLRV